MDSIAKSPSTTTPCGGACVVTNDVAKTPGGSASNGGMGADPVLSERITVIITTSPVKSNPCTLMLEEVIKSFEFAGPGLSSSRILITFDGCNVNESEKPSNYRSGRVDPPSAARYIDYKRKIEDLCEATTGVWSRCEALFLDRRYGFGFAVREALKSCETEFVLVVQHDRSFMRYVDIDSVVLAMDEKPQMAFVGFHTSSTINYKERMESKYRVMLPYTEAAGQRFLPMIYWLDSTHLARSDWYRKFVFGRDEKGKQKKLCLLFDESEDV